MTTEITNTKTEEINKIKTVSWFDDRFYRIEQENQDIEFYPSVTTILGIVNKPFLGRWRGDIGNTEADKRLQEAGDSGTRKHHACEAIVSGGMAIFNPKYHPNYTLNEIKELQEKYGYKLIIIEDQHEWLHVWRFKQWIDVVKPINIATEMIVIDKEKKVAGSLDYLWWIAEGEFMISGSKPVKLESGYYIVDLKTGNNLDDDSGLQISKYGHSFEQMVKDGNIEFKLNGVPITDIQGGLIIHTNAKTRTGIQGLQTVVYTKEEMIENNEMFDNSYLPMWLRKNKNTQPKCFDMPTALYLES